MLYILFQHFFVVFHHKICISILFIFLDEVSNFCNITLTNQKHELVVPNCHWSCMIKLILVSHRKFMLQGKQKTRKPLTWIWKLFGCVTAMHLITKYSRKMSQVNIQGEMFTFQEVFNKYISLSIPLRKVFQKTDFL